MENFDSGKNDATLCTIFMLQIKVLLLRLYFVVHIVAVSSYPTRRKRPIWTHYVVPDP